MIYSKYVGNHIIAQSLIRQAVKDKNWSAINDRNDEGESALVLAMKKNGKLQ